MVEHLETTLEVPGGGAACSVCPWDEPEPVIPTAVAAISVSVCPWESETELPSSQQLPAIVQPQKYIFEIFSVGSK